MASGLRKQRRNFGCHQLYLLFTLLPAPFTLLLSLLLRPAPGSRHPTPASCLLSPAYCSCLGQRPSILHPNQIDIEADRMRAVPLSLTNPNNQTRPGWVRRERFVPTPTKVNLKTELELDWSLWRCFVLKSGIILIILTCVRSIACGAS